MQFRRTVGLFNNQNFLKCNMNQPFLSDITMHQCHITTFCACSPLILLHMVLFFVFIFPPRQLRNQILKLAFAIRFLFICIFYSSIHIWLYTCIIDLIGDIEKNPGTQAKFFSKFFDLSLEPKQYNWAFLCKKISQFINLI